MSICAGFYEEKLEEATKAAAKKIQWEQEILIFLN